MIFLLIFKITVLGMPFQEKFFNFFSGGPKKQSTIIIERQYTPKRKSVYCFSNDFKNDDIRST